MSVFKQIISLRDNFAEKALHSINALNAIANPDDTIDLDDFDLIPISNGMSLKVLQNELSLHDQNGSIIDTIQYHDVSELQANVAGYDFTWSQLVDKISDGTTTYQLASELLSKYSYSNRVQYSDVFNYVNMYDVSDKTVLLDSLFSATDDDGYISRNNFLAVLKSWTSNGQKAASRNSYDVDTTNPYGLQSIMNMFVDVIDQAVNVVCVALTLAFRTIGFLIAGILSILVRLIGKLDVMKLMEVDSESSTNYVKGPILCLDDTEIITIDMPVAASRVNLTESNGIALFTWLADFDQPAGSCRANAYLYPCWKPLDTIKDIMNQGVQYHPADQDEGVPAYVTITNVYDLGYKWGSLSAQWLRYGNNEEPKDKVEIALSLIVDYVLRALTAYRKVYGDSSAETIQFSVGLMGTPVGMDNDNLGVFRCFGQIVEYVSAHPSASLTDVLSDCYQNIYYGINHLTNYVKNVIFPYRDVANTSSGLHSSDVMPIENGSALGVFYKLPFLKSIMLGMGRNAAYLEDSSFSLRIVGTDTNSSADYTYYTDCLPTEFGITLPAFDAEKITSNLIALGFATTVLAIGFSTVKKVMTKRAISRNALRASNLNDLRDQYLADPTNEAKRIAFQNAAYKYNKFGKWFGWGSYDSANGWIDSSVGADLTQSTLQIDAIGQNRKLVSQSNDLIEQILRLIR